jgi:hypothetical protein
MPTEFESLFVRLRAILQKHRGAWTVSEDSSICYSLAGSVGPATLRAWGGKLKHSSIPIAWVQIGKAYVSYHLMGIHGNTHLLGGMSKKLSARMQGKTCFNFKGHDEVLFEELDELTNQAIEAFRKIGYIRD